MSHPRSTVHHFWFYVQFKENIFSGKCFSLVENDTKLLQENLYTAHLGIYDHQWSFVHHFFPLNKPVIEKYSLGKSVFISEKKQKCTSKSINLVQIKYI